VTDWSRVAPAAAARIVRGLAGLLEHPEAEALARLTQGKDWYAWAPIARLITIHGLGPHLIRSGNTLERSRDLPELMFDWLAERDVLNAQRIDIMHGELAAILAAAAADGISVMPLKGALLTTMPGTDPRRRPMSDLDLLVRPVDRERLGTLLERLNYRRAREANPRDTHDVYVDPGGGRVVSLDEHPNNPRRVEVHVELVRHLWSWLDEDQLTEAMWSDATPGEICGFPAMLPARHHVLAHVAIHATADLLGGRGRLLQWLDFADLAGDGAAVSLAALPHPRVAYPALRLAQRALPNRLAALDVEGLETKMPRQLVRWARSVPLDHRSGLMIGPQRTTPHSLAARAKRWAPVPWRLSVAYGDRPPPIAMALHARLVAGRWRGRFSFREPRPEGD